MARIAILGGGIAGLAAAYECEQLRMAGKPLDWYLYEATERLGGTLATTRIQTAEGEYILEDGPDGWVTEKPWARELAVELGLSNEIIACNEAEKRTYVRLDGRLVPMPDRMRLMVPGDLAALEGSPLFTEEAKRAYRLELTRSSELRASAPGHDESVASFVRRHFGHEVLTKIAAPLLSGVFGGDVERLSVRAVMPQFVQMEAEHGSLVAAVQGRAKARGTEPPAPTFTSLRRGMGSLTEALVAALPSERLQTGVAAVALRGGAKDGSGGNWLVQFGGANARSCAIGFVPFDHVLLATPGDATRQLLSSVDGDAASLIPVEASSAILVTFCWPEATATSMTVPPGFGFLVPPGSDAHQLLAATFTNQKYPHRAPEGSRVIRAFFGSAAAEQMAGLPDQEVARAALEQLRGIMGPLPEPDLNTVRRWPRSLPQYEVGHLDRMAELGKRIQALGHLHLLGNSYYGVGVPDLIRDARKAARTLSESLT